MNFNEKYTTQSKKTEEPEKEKEKTVIDEAQYELINAIYYLASKIK